VIAGVGGLKRVSAAVFVNQRLEGQADDRKLVTRSAADLDKLKRAAERALGLTDKDPLGEVVVEELPFNEEAQQKETARVDRDALWTRGIELSRILGAVGVSGLILLILWRMLRRGSEELLAAGVPVGQLIGTPQMAMAGVPGAAVAMAAGGGGAADGSGDDDAEDDQEAQEKKKKMKMDFGLSKQRPERVTLEVLKDLIRDNPQKMVQAARAWLVSEPEKE